MKDKVKLSELKVGDKFYQPFNDLISIFVNCIVDESNQNCIEYHCKLLNTKDIEIHKIYSTNAINQEVYKYNGRDKSSFFAGFRFAMKHCVKYMGIFDLQNAELDDKFKQHLTMLKQYDNWKKNKEIL